MIPRVCLLTGGRGSNNHALTDADESHFVRELIANLTVYPSYYAQMGPANSVVGLAGVFL